MTGSVLVAGGTGFLGANFVRSLYVKGYEVRATWHEKWPRFKPHHIDWVRSNLIYREDCETAVDGMDYVFMCAAVTSGAHVMVNDPLAHVTPNIVMNTYMLDAAYRAGVKKFVFISSSAAYPDTGDRPTSEDEMFYGHPYYSYFAVGWMKRMAEILCATYALRVPEKTMKVLVIRPSNVYGPYDKFDPLESHMTAAMVRKVVERQDPIEIWGTGQDVRDLIYVEDFVNGVLKAFERDDRLAVYNIGSGEGYTVEEVLHTAAHADGYFSHAVVTNPTRPSTIPIRLIDVSKAREELGFEAETTLEEGLRKTVEWYRKSVQ